MYDENAEFTLTWTSPRYPTYTQDETGTWRYVFDNDVAVGVVWVNDSMMGTGVLWVEQTDIINDLRKHFSNAFAANTPAQLAYNATEFLPGVKLGEEQIGPLSGVDEALQELGEGA